MDGKRNNIPRVCSYLWLCTQNPLSVRLAAAISAGGESQNTSHQFIWFLHRNPRVSNQPGLVAVKVCTQRPQSLPLVAVSSGDSATGGLLSLKT